MKKKKSTTDTLLTLLLSKSKDIDVKGMKVSDHVFFRHKNGEPIGEFENIQINLKDNTIEAQIKLTPEQIKKFEELYGVKLQ